jgi:hypothetical protein
MTLAETSARQILALRGETKCSAELEDLIDAAVRYARLRVDWVRMDPIERTTVDMARSSAHDVFIDSCNILSRMMLQASESNEWRARLGADRGFIGDVACHIHCLLGLSAR